MYLDWALQKHSARKSDDWPHLPWPWVPWPSASSAARKLVFATPEGEESDLFRWHIGGLQKYLPSGHVAAGAERQQLPAAGEELLGPHQHALGT
jgi:hypothetical protein